MRRVVLLGASFLFLTAAAEGPRPLPELPPHPNLVVVVPVEGTIDLGVAPFLTRQIERLGPEDVLVLDINTFGGRIDAAVVIRDALLHSKAKTVCWVNPRAISAGALISLACDVIAVAPGSTIGAATPVQIGEGGEMKPVEEKVVSYMRKEMRATAEAKGRRGDIAEAMVNADVEIPGLDEKGKLLTLEGKQALAYGIADITAANETELWAALRIAPDGVEKPSLSWAERLARFLSDPAISGILMTIGMLGILVELYSGGHGIALVAGLACLGLFFFGHLVVKLAGWEEVILFVAGAGLLAFEIFVPGHIIPGILGVLCIVAAMVMALVNLDAVPLEVAWKDGAIPSALATVFASILATTVLGITIGQILPRTRVGRALVLESAITARAHDPASIEKMGVAATMLRPAGKVTLGGRRIDAVAERGYIDEGARVEVVRKEGLTVVVREVRS